MSDNEMEQHVIEKGESLVRFLKKNVVYGILILAVLMILLVFISIIDVAYIFYDTIVTSTPMGILGTEGLLTILGAFIAVLIAIEIFNNIILYLKDDKTHVKLVLATALIAISRKVIILDYHNMEPSYIYATAAVIFATALAYWLVANKTER